MKKSIGDIKEFALFLYEPLLKKQVSKAVVAQHVAKLLREEKEINERILSDVNVGYIVDAIKYATKVSVK